MALERWFYTQIERGENIDHWIERILVESASLAFAGLLFDVGKRHSIPPNALSAAASVMSGSSENL